MSTKTSTRVVSSTKLTAGEQKALHVEARIRGLNPSEALRLAGRMWVSVSRSSRNAPAPCEMCGGADDAGHSPSCERYSTD